MSLAKNFAFRNKNIEEMHKLLLPKQSQRKIHGNQIH